MDLFDWVIRFVHVLAGVTWVGGIFLWGMVIGPSVVKRVPPQVRGPFMSAVLPRVSRYLSIAGVLTVITGFWTMGLIWGFGNLAPTFQVWPYGYALGLGALASIVMLALAFVVVVPSANKLLGIMAKAPAPEPGAAPAAPPPEVMRLQKRLMIAGMTNLLLGFAAIGFMVWAVGSRTGM